MVACVGYVCMNICVCVCVCVCVCLTLCVRGREGEGKREREREREREWTMEGNPPFVALEPTPRNPSCLLQFRSRLSVFSSIHFRSFPVVSTPPRTCQSHSYKLRLAVTKGTRSSIKFRLAVTKGARSSIVSSAEGGVHTFSFTCLLKALVSDNMRSRNLLSFIEF